MGTSTEPWALDNERPAHVVDLPPFWIDTAPVTNAAYLEFIAAGGYDDAALLDQAGWAHRQRAGLTAPQYWRRERASGCAPGSGSPSRCRPPSRSCTCAGTRRTPTPGGPAAACPARPNGRRRPGTTRPPACPGGSRGGTGSPPGPRQPGPAAPPARPGGPLPGGAARSGARQLIGDVWEWTSSDFLPYPGFTAWPYKEYSEVFFGPSTRCCAAARSRRTRWSAAARSATGTTRSGGRSSAGCGRPGTPRPGAGPRSAGRGVTPPMCRMRLPRAAGHPAVGAYRPAARAAAPVLGAPAAESGGTVQRRRVRGRLVPGGTRSRPATGARCRDLGRCVVRRPGPGDPDRGGAGRGALRTVGRPGRGRRRPVRRGPLAVQPQRGADGWPDATGRAGRHAAGRRPAHPRGARPIPRCCGRWCPRLRAGASPGRRARRTVAEVDAAGVTGRFNFLLTDGDDDRGHRGRRHAVLLRGRPGRGRLRTIDDEPGWRACRTGAC